MESKTIPAVFGINKVLWAAIVDSGIITDTTNYNGLLPIVPTQEESQLLSAMDSKPGIASFPYIVYSWHTNTVDSSSWYKMTDMVTYKIYALDQRDLRRLVLLITDLFKRYDDSAAMINEYLAKAYPVPTAVPEGSPPGTPAVPVADGPGVAGYEYRCYHYNFTSVVASSGGTPQSAENDPNTAVINLRVNYLDSRNDAVLVAPPLPPQ